MKKGERVTVCYVNPYKHIRVVFIEVVKKGRKYIHGITLWIDHDGQVRKGRPVKYEMDKVTIYQGIRQDLRKKLRDYEDSLKIWHNNLELYKRDIDSELRIIKEEKISAWRKQTPRPIPPNFDVCDEGGM